MIWDIAEYACFLSDKTSALREVKALPKAWDLFSYNIPQGAGEGVLVIPGYNAVDKTTRGLRDRLQEKGFLSFGAGLAETAMDFNDAVFETVTRRLYEITDSLGTRINIVGHSAGGVFARELGMRHPERVAHVVTLASDFDFSRLPSIGGVPILEIFHRVSKRFPGFDMSGFLAHLTEPPKIPVTSVFSAGDAFVRANLSVNRPEWELAEDVIVTRTNTSLLGGDAKISAPSHMSLTASIQVITCICDRLRQGTRHGWKRFEPGRFPVFPRSPDSL